MPVKHSCFISYAHDDGLLVKQFIDNLVEALKAELGGYLDKGVCIDKDRLKPGYLYNEALAESICCSTCMIVVYSPKYRRHNYCLREFEAMTRIEQARIDRMKKKLGDKFPRGYGLIIPIILRGKLEDIPRAISDKRHYADFSKFTTASPAITKTEDLIEQVGRIVSYINEIYDIFESFEKTGESIYNDCQEFHLPGEAEIQPWPKKPDQQFPLR